MTDVERQYARALFSLALEKDEIEEIYGELNTFVKSLDNSINSFFMHPKIEIMEKHQVIENIVKNHLLANFLKVLLDNSRFELLPTIVYAYLDLINEMNEIVEVNIISNIKMSEGNLKKIKTNLETKLLKKVKIIERLDSSIIGGIKIEYQGNIIDQTINASLDGLRQSLKGGN